MKRNIQAEEQHGHEPVVIAAKVEYTHVDFADFRAELVKTLSTPGFLPAQIAADVAAALASDSANVELILDAAAFSAVNVVRKAAGSGCDLEPVR